MIKKSLFFLLSSLVLASSSISAQPVWSQIGSDLDGNATLEYFGYSLAMSSDGSILAVGGYNYNASYPMMGRVCVYQNNAGTWQQIGNSVVGEAMGDNSAWSVSLSDDGTILAIGAVYNDGSFSNAGHVRVYQFTEGNWVQLGSDIEGEAADDYFGYAVQLNSDGTILATSAPNNDQAGAEAGNVRVFAYSVGNWVQVGDAILGEAAGDKFGTSLDISDDGSIVAVGAPYNAGNGTWAGHARVFHNNSGTWEQIGSDIDGEFADDISGCSVALSASGDILAVGARGNDGAGSYSGHVRVWHNNNGTWEQVGADINGESSNTNSGWAVDLNPVGDVVAIGAPNNPGNGPSSGSVRVYFYDDGVWQKRGPDIDGEAEYDNFGCAVAINDDGLILAAGANNNDGTATSAGHARVFDYSCSLGAPPIPDVLNLLPVTDECSATVTETPTAHDVCGAPLIGTTTDPLTYNTQGTYTLTWTYEDSEGNIMTQTQDVIIEDETPPTIECIENQTKNLTEGQTFYTVSGNEFDPVSTDDNCAVESLENDFNNLNTLNGEQIAIGLHTIVWSLTDIAGNVETCSFTIDVVAFSDIRESINTSLRFSPNPFSTNLTIDRIPADILSITIVTYTGQTVKSFSPTMDKTVQLNLSDLQNGIYFIIIKSDMHVWNAKIIKQ